MTAAIPLINAIDVLLTPLAGPYRSIMYKFRTFPGVGKGFLTWLGVIVGYPVFYCRWPPSGEPSPRAFFIGWALLSLCTYAQMMVKWCSSRPRRYEGDTQSWFGGYEPVFTAIFALFAQIISPGVSFFIIAGYTASLIQIGFYHLKRFCERWTPEDTRRVVDPLRTGAQKIGPAASTGARFTSSAFRTAAIALMPFGALLFRGTKAAFGGTAQAATAGATAYRPPSFLGRVMSFVVGHMVFSLLTGTLGIFGLIKCAGMILAIPAAILLWLLGGKADLPFFIKEDAHRVVNSAKEALEDKKEEAIERLKEREEEVKERLADVKEKLPGMMEEGKEQVREEIGRRKRKAIRKYVFGQ